MKDIILQAEGLRREFNERLAVDDVNVQIKAGEVLGLLGPNGAGKTTTVRICSTLLIPTSGSVVVDGVDAIANPREARRRTGLVLGGESGFYARATARRNLLFFADVAGVQSAVRKARVCEALAAVSLNDRADDPVREFSRGMKQRLHIARALLNQPKLLLLDEPTNGLDPQSAANARALIKTLSARGTAILLTSHHMAEVEQLANRVQVIARGREIANGSVRDIALASGVASVSTFSIDVPPAPLAKALGNTAGPLDITEQAGRWQVRVPWRQPGASGDMIAAWCASVGAAVPVDLVTRPATLEESYLALVSS